MQALGLSGGVVIEDLDGDAALDIMISSWGLRDPLRVFLNDGDGRFDERTDSAGLEGLTGGLNLIHADYDNDGDADVLVLRGAWLGSQGAYPNSLLRNRGDGTFVDVTREAGLLSFHPTQTAAWADYDNDGLLDLFVGNESVAGPSVALRAVPQRRRRHLSPRSPPRSGSITSVSSRAWPGATTTTTAGSISTFPSWMSRTSCSTTTAATALALHRRRAAAGVEAPLDSFPAWFWDYDNDGRLDSVRRAVPRLRVEVAE